MNIFYLDTDPKECARMHCDAHVRKMILEYAQILSTTHRCLCPNDPINKLRYKAAFVNHPSTIWARQSFENYIYLSHLWFYLCEEYEYRWNKTHATHNKLVKYLNICPQPLFSNCSKLTPIPLCMPEDCQSDSPTASYRDYYVTHKKHLLQYTKRPQPDWIERN